MQAARDDAVLVVELQGDSMQPVLPRGCRLRVEPLDPGAPLRPGEIVVLRGALGLVVHRLVWLSSAAGDQHLVHRGDAGGRLGVALKSALVGRVRAVLVPALPLPTIEALGPEALLAFARAQRRARLFLILAGLRRALGRVGLRLDGPAAWLRGQLLS